MYREFLILVYDYFSISKKFLIFDMALPLFATTVLAVFAFDIIVFNDAYLGQIITLLGILAGFNTTVISVLTSTSNSNIDRLKEKFSGKRISGKKISLFQELYVYISYSILISFFVISVSIFGYLLPTYEILNPIFFSIAGFITVFLILHIMFLNIRNISFLYFTFFEHK